MHKYLYFIVLFSFITAYSQQNSTFVGNWIWEKDNKTFKVHLYEEGKILKGDYSLITNDKQVIYKSNKLINSDFNLYFGHAINGNSKNGKLFEGLIRDNVLYGDKIHTIKNGELKILINNDNTATWSVTALITHTNKRKSLKLPKDFTIPTNIILIREKK